MSEYGTIVTEKQVRAAVKAHLLEWTPAYLAELARQDGLADNAYPLFRSYVSSGDAIETWPEDQLPACVIVAPTLAAPPERNGRHFSAQWLVGIGVVVSANDREATADLVGQYTAAVRGAMTQHGSVGGFAEETVWLDERYNELGNDGSRTIAAGRNLFRVTIPKVMQVYGGPMQPPASQVAPDPDPTVATTVTTIERMP